METKQTMSRGAPPGATGDADVWDGDGWADGGEPLDRALIDRALEMAVAENRARAARMEAVSEFHSRRVAEVEARAAGHPGPWDDQPGFFLLTPLEATKAELAPLLAVSELYLQIELELADDLKRWLPRVWRRCLDGRLDIGRAQALQAHLASLASDGDRAAYAEEVETWIERHDDPDAPVYPVSRLALQRAARRLCRKHPQRSADESFASAFGKRRVSVRAEEDGMGTLSCTTAVHDLIRADHRLTLIAKKRREMDGEERTLSQLRVDSLVDLVLGRLSVGAGDGELEDDCVAGSGCAEHEDGDGDAACADPLATFDWSTVGQFARPILNVTVPLATLLGVSEEGGVLAGGIPVPADLAREIAGDPDSVWYRMLTDPAGGFVELSTDSYTPNGAIWRWTAARDVACVFPGCSRPATVVELDHRLPWPRGRTSTWNVQPLCKRHHKVKHSRGFRVVRESDGSYTWTSRFGSVTRKPPPDYPVATWEELVGEVTGSRPGESVPCDDEAQAGGGWSDRLDGAFEEAFRRWFDQETATAS